MNIIIYLSAVMAVALADTTDLERMLNDGNNAFSAKFFSEVVKENRGSVVMSAFSVLQPLAQLALASVGESHDELLRAIGLPSDNATKEVFPVVNSKLLAIRGVELKMANKIYVALNSELNPEFTAVSRIVFGSEFKNINFVESQSAAKEINDWVEDHTNHRIKNLVNPDSLNSDTRAVLVNALYFKGEWVEKFNKNLTEERDFHVTKERTVKVPTMYKKADFKYGESSELDAKLLELPYEGREASMLIVLPNEIDGLAQLQEKLKNPAALDQAVRNMYTTEVNVYLPKFKIETTINLKQVLQAMGVNSLFNANTARLDNLLKNNQGGLYISDAIQKAFIEVNEEGAEAAAANAFHAVFRSARVSPIVIFDANRPFFYQLVTGTNVLFHGVYKS